MQHRLFSKKGKFPTVRFALSLWCALAFGVCLAETCITADEYNHVQNGGSPLPGTTTTALSSSSATIDAVTCTESLCGPLPLARVGMVVVVF
jgi:hypothetical protein